MATSKDLQPGLFDLDEPQFDTISQTNGSRFWYARDLMAALGYDTWASFKKTINRALAACAASNTPIVENFIQCTRILNGKGVEDFKLTRCACLFVAMNGDPKKKPMIAAAQAYFAALALAVQDIPVEPESLDRVVMREEISGREVTLNKAATEAGVEFYGRFQNAGYRGMYNMDYNTLKHRKQIPDLRRSLLDFMGKDELAANLFRLTLTEGRIKKDGIRGQAALQQTAEQVGRRVREAMIEETGKRPEDLPITTDIKLVRRALRSTGKSFPELIDNLEEQRKYEASAMALLESGPVEGCVEYGAGVHASHFGSPQCTSGSLASGGTIAHCDCDYCREAGQH